jgi:transcriptional antiterminator NusG
MVLTSDSWYLIRNTQGVTGFVGQGSDPIPLTDEEVRHMGIDRTRVKIDLEIGDRVRIIDGAYKDYMLVVDDIDLTREKIKGRLGQVTMDIPFDLVEKIV